MTSLELLEEEIRENVEWLDTIGVGEIECISIENLEGILTRFFDKKVILTQK
jgi:hypothetical protein